MPNKEVVVLIGAGSIGVAISRRVSIGKHIVIADRSKENINKVSQILEESGYETSQIEVDISSRDSIKNLVSFATSKGEIKHLIQAAGVSPSQSTVENILKVDLYGTAVILELFGNVIKEGGSGIVISSQSGYRLPALTEDEDEGEDRLLATKPAEELLNLPMIKDVDDTLKAYQISKRGNGLRVKAESIHWAKRRARVNTISPGIIMTPLAKDELTGDRADFYNHMLNNIPAQRAGVPDEIADLAELLLTERGSFITGSDFLADGGAKASYFYGPLQP